MYEDWLRLAAEHAAPETVVALADEIVAHGPLSALVAVAVRNDIPEPVAVRALQAALAEANFDTSVTGPVSGCATSLPGVQQLFVACATPEQVRPFAENVSDPTAARLLLARALTDPQGETGHVFQDGGRRWFRFADLALTLVRRRDLMPVWASDEPADPSWPTQATLTEKLLAAAAEHPDDNELSDTLVTWGLYAPEQVTDALLGRDKAQELACAVRRSWAPQRLLDAVVDRLAGDFDARLLHDVYDRVTPAQQQVLRDLVAQVNVTDTMVYADWLRKLARTVEVDEVTSAAYWTRLPAGQVATEAAKESFRLCDVALYAVLARRDIDTALAWKLTRKSNPHTPRMLEVRAFDEDYLVEVFCGYPGWLGRLEDPGLAVRVGRRVLTGDRDHTDAVVKAGWFDLLGERVWELPLAAVTRWAAAEPRLAAALAARLAALVAGRGVSSEAVRQLLDSPEAAVLPAGMVVESVGSALVDVPMPVGA